MQASLFAILTLSILTFVLYVYDKRCAENNSWRISEFMLLFTAATGGAMGALAAMYICHHKTLKPHFVYGIPLMIITQTILLIILANIFL